MKAEQSAAAPEQWLTAAKAKQSAVAPKPPTFKGRKHTDETRARMREAHRKIGLAKRNGTKRSNG